VRSWSTSVTGASLKGVSPYCGSLNSGENLKITQVRVNGVKQDRRVLLRTGKAESLSGSGRGLQREEKRKKAPQRKGAKRYTGERRIDLRPHAGGKPGRGSKRLNITPSSRPKRGPGRAIYLREREKLVPKHAPSGKPKRGKTPLRGIEGKSTGHSGTLVPAPPGRDAGK